ncbi:F-box/WD repeat-containing protein 7 isoform X3 [Corvus hawaiiensis]|uniref:F-box/WD repeat-containing protein 7 isoform X3 n=2 Tax=Corvus TaxID=30420 RepID=UPI000901A67A|nr:F-box/WD repeat-containing protein 7 isoform X3 [Corvus kubaryi]XP_048159583.1 F-box/WD repeat-containing protein 7 isoform X3 [Corvus hawaiiensis]
MSKSMCGCGCSIISSLMKRLGCSTCCSNLLSCSHTSEQLQRLSIECLNQPKKNVKAFASSDSLAKVQEVASWLLEMNQELLSVGSKRRRTGGSLRGNASSSQVDEEQMNRVVEEEEQQQRRQQEEQHIGRNGEIGGEEPGFDGRHESQQEQLEENNNRLITVDEDSTCNQEEDDDEHAGDQEEEVEEEEEMDQDSDDFDQSDDSSREDEHANSNSVTNSNSLMDLPIHQSSPFYMKTKIPFWRRALLTLQGRSTSCLTDTSSLPAPWWFNSCLY